MGASSWSCSCATPSMSLSDSWAPACHDCCNMLSHLRTLMSILKSLQMHEHVLMQTKSLGLRWNLKCCRIAVRCSRLSPSQPAPGEQKCLQLLHSSRKTRDLAKTQQDMAKPTRFSIKFYHPGRLGYTIWPGHYTWHPPVTPNPESPKLQEPRAWLFLCVAAYPQLLLICRSLDVKLS